MYTEAEGKCGSMVSKSKVDANNKWTNSNMKIINVKIRNEQAEEFKRLCELNGDTAYGVLKKAIEDYIEQNKPM